MSEVPYTVDRYANPYAKSLDEANELTRQLLAECPPYSDRRHVVFRFEADDPYGDIGRIIERTVFEETFGNDAQQMLEEYGPYDHLSKFFVTIDTQTARPTGVERIIEGRMDEIKTPRDLEAIGVMTSGEIMEAHSIAPEDRVCDVGTLAVLPEFRDKVGPVSLQLFRGVYVDMCERGVRHTMAIIDQQAYRKFIKVIGLPFVPLAGQKRPFSYLGSEKSRAIYGDPQEFYAKMNGPLARALAFVALGTGLRQARQRLIEGRDDDALMW